MKNFFNSGEYVIPIPIGVPIKLQYNSKGHLESVFVELEDKSQDVTAELRDVFLSHHTCPPTISVQGGTTWVFGVLYSSDMFLRPGVIPNCIVSDMIDGYRCTPDEFTFYAYWINSFAARFRGAAPIRQWLTLSKFEVLPGWVVPTDNTKDKFDAMVQKSRFHFNPNRIMMYGVFHDQEFRLEKLDLVQTHCKSVTMVTDHNGYLYGEIECDNGTPVSLLLRVPYSRIAAFGVRSNSGILVQGSNICWCSTMNSNRYHRIPCPSCGRYIDIPHDGATLCSDYHCKSRLYSRYSQFCSVLNLPMLPWDMFQSASNNISSLFDIFGTDVHKDQKIRASLSDVLRSLVPLDIVPDSTILQKFVNRCNNSVDTVMYYLNHLDKISVDLDLSPGQVRGLVTWFEDPENMLELYTICNLPNVTIDDSIRKFDGPPIFRGKTLALTGTFRHGSYDEVTAIIRSYSGDVASFTDKVDGLLIGDIKEGINSQWIQTCRSAGIPIMQESEFFSTYDINEDLANNLV